MESSDQKPNIKHHLLSSYYERRQEILLELQTVIHHVELDDTKTALEHLQSAKIRLKYMAQG